MYFKFESTNNSFKPILIYDYKSFVKTYKIYPIKSARSRFTTQGIYIFESFSDVFKLPRKENKSYDSPFKDGIVHYNATYKPNTWTVNLFSNETELMGQIHPLYLSRGLIKCTIGTDWGTTNISYIRAIDFDEFKMSLTFENPSTNVVINQNSNYIFKASRLTSGLFVAPKLYVADTLYPHLQQTNFKLNDNTVQNISNKSKWTHKFTTDALLLRLNKININGQDTIMTPFIIKNNDVIVMDFATDAFTLNGVSIGKCSTNVKGVDYSNYVKYDISDTDTTPTENITLNINLNVTGTLNGNTNT